MFSAAPAISSIENTVSEAVCLILSVNLPTLSPDLTAILSMVWSKSNAVLAIPLNDKSAPDMPLTSCKKPLPT